MYTDTFLLHTLRWGNARTSFHCSGQSFPFEVPEIYFHLKPSYFLIIVFLLWFCYSILSTISIAELYSYFMKTFYKRISVWKRPHSNTPFGPQTIIYSTNILCKTACIYLLKIEVIQKKRLYFQGWFEVVISQPEWISFV